MFERFTERARQVIVFAQDEARRFHHNYIGTEHILLGLLRETDGVAARTLTALDISVDEVRTEVKRRIGAGDVFVDGQIPFTPRAKKILDLALREALSLGHSWIDTEHILLGLVRENEGVAARILRDYDADDEKIRDQIIRALRTPRAPEGRQARVHSLQQTLQRLVNASDNRVYINALDELTRLAITPFASDDGTDAQANVS